MKRLLSLALVLAAIVSLCGCASLFDKEYYSSEAYQAQAVTEDEEDAAFDSITNYSALRRAITQLVTEHVEAAELQLQNYDGSISQDISTACWEVKSSTAIGAFAVDYISYDLSRIVSYYQAEIYITYKRSADQVSALEDIAGMTALAERMDEAIRANETYLVLEISSASATADAVAEDVGQAYYADPLACPVLPSVEVGVYPETGVNRILEITLNYAYEAEELALRRQALGLALDVMVSEAAPGAETESSAEPSMTEEERVAALARYIAENCTADETAGTTAWDALVAGTAGSEGIAMALEAGCQAVGVACQTVSGRLNNEAHNWNIVTVDGAQYHVDVSNRAAGTDGVFLVSDEELWSGGYWWDTSEYPVCGAGYYDEPAEQTSQEPADL